MVSIRKQVRGFTLVEVLVALMVASIILAAAATMAGALSSGKTANDQVSRNGAYLLQLQTRLSDLIMRANGVAGINSQILTLWLDKNNNGIRNSPTEDVQIKTGIDRSSIIIEDIGSIISGTGKSEEYTQFSNIQYDCRDGNLIFTTTPSQVKHITIKFDVIENGVTQTYCVSGTLRGKN